VRGRLIFVGTVHEAIPELGALLGSGVRKFAVFETLSSTQRAWPMPGRSAAEPFAVLRDVL
jgi:hypothetical protein